MWNGSATGLAWVGFRAAQLRVKNLKKGIDLMHAIGSDHTVNMRRCNVCYGFIKARVRVENREIDDEIHEITT